MLAAIEKLRNAPGWEIPRRDFPHGKGSAPRRPGLLSRRVMTHYGIGSHGFEVLQPGGN
jgi:hypothetical protein